MRGAPVPRATKHRRATNFLWTERPLDFAQSSVFRFEGSWDEENDDDDDDDDEEEEEEEDDDDDDDEDDDDDDDDYHN